MAKTRVIPSTESPWVCSINGVHYSYTAGSTQSVPDEVAELIDVINGAVPKTETKPDGYVWTKKGNGAEFEAVPTPSITDGDIDSEEATSGKVLTADGSGGASWGNIYNSTTAHSITITTSNGTFIIKLLDFRGKPSLAPTYADLYNFFHEYIYVIPITEVIYKSKPFVGLGISSTNIGGYSDGAYVQIQSTAVTNINWTTSSYYRTL